MVITPEIILNAFKKIGLRPMQNITLSNGCCCAIMAVAMDNGYVGDCLTGAFDACRKAGYNQQDLVEISKGWDNIIPKEHADWKLGNEAWDLCSRELLQTTCA